MDKYFMDKYFMNGIKLGLGFFFIVGILTSGFVWADTNGIWHYAKDIKSGIFGADEDGVGGGFSFISDVAFNADVNLNDVNNCAGKLITQADGTIYCGVDNVNDADFDATNELQSLSINDHTINLSNGGGSILVPDNVNDTDNIIGNEYPIAGVGISVSDRIVNVDTSVVATKNYVNSVVNPLDGCTIEYRFYRNYVDGPWRSIALDGNSHTGSRSSIYVGSFDDECSGGNGCGVQMKIVC